MGAGRPHATGSFQLTSPHAPGRFQRGGTLFNPSWASFVSAMTLNRLDPRIHWAGSSLVAVGMSLLLVAGLAGQDRALVVVDENIRAEPQGALIGRLPVGTVLDVLQVDGRWAQVRLQGWIWTQSLQSTDRMGFDLAVSATPHENLRAEPSGTILARMLEGALLERVEEVPGWTSVRRVAWVWGPSLEIRESGDAPSPAAEAPGQRSSGTSDWWRSGPGGSTILTGPDGDTLAETRGGAELQVLARQGNWTRVRLEGWIWAPSGQESDSASTGIVSDLTPEGVSTDPESARGRVVSWELQFVSMEEAERVRTDFYEGEPFLLTRAVSSDRTFVYVAIPPERLGDVEGLTPLERIRVVGRIRTGSAALTGNPILDLLELTRISRD